MKEGEGHGWSPGYVDAIGEVVHRLPEPLLRTPLGEVDPEHFYRALVSLPVPIHRLDKLRSFMSKVPRSELSANAGYQLSARDTTDLYHRVLREEWSPDFQRRLSEYEPLVPKVLASLRSDLDHWVPAMALSMYLRTGAKQALLLRARWSSILDEHWYPYPPHSRASWFWAREALDDDLQEDLEEHRQRVAEHFGITDLMFPSLHRDGDLEPITSVTRAFRRTLRASGVSRPTTIRLRDFALVAKRRSTPVALMNPNNFVFRVLRQVRAEEMALVAARLSKD